MPTPDVPSLEKKTGSVTIAGVDAGATVTQTITISGNVIIIGMPKVTTPTANATVKLINGGEKEFTVEVTNNAGSAQDVVVDYEVLVIRRA